MTAVAAYKRRTHELLADARRVLDIGCGPGVDLVERGHTRSIGIDPAAAMWAAAARRGSTVVRADAQALLFVTDSFDGARADRVFQHLSDPDAALREVVRVLVTGGRLVIAGPDQESPVIQVPGTPQRMLSLATSV